jgi:hypothetical protein
MFESTILTALQSDATLAALVTTYNNSPAIFSDVAPEGAEMPYITFRITEGISNHPVIKTATLYTDYWHYGTSKAKARQAAERMELLLDKKEFEHERYSNIRVSFFSAGSVDEDDPKVIHYNQMYQCRMGRKKWSEQL